MMRKLLFDTNVFIDHLRGYQAATKYLLQEKQGAIFLTSAITVAELYSGVRNKHEKNDLERVLTFFQTIPVDHELSIAGGEICKTYEKSHGTDLMDALIAATAQQHDAILITLNTKHFPMVKTLKPY